MFLKTGKPGLEDHGAYHVFAAGFTFDQDRSPRLFWYAAHGDRLLSVLSGIDEPERQAAEEFLTIVVPGRNPFTGAFHPVEADFFPGSFHGFRQVLDTAAVFGGEKFIPGSGLGLRRIQTVVLTGIGNPNPVFRSFLPPDHPAPAGRISAQRPKVVYVHTITSF
jgi:hypothetical protein